MKCSYCEAADTLIITAVGHELVIDRGPGNVKEPRIDQDSETPINLCRECFCDLVICRKDCS